MHIDLEICVDHWEGALAAHAGGANRLEVCGPLSSGGVTPSAGLVALCTTLPGMTTMQMIRPHDGDFVYSERDVESMLREIEWAHRLGVHGVVWGALTADGRIDTTVCRRLLDASRPLEITFHRAFDGLTSLVDGLNDLLELGVDRLLTSGGQLSAWEGRAVISQLVEKAAGRIRVMPGSGVDETNARALLRETGALEIHASASRPRPVHSSNSPVQFGHGVRQTQVERVQALRAAIDGP